MRLSIFSRLVTGYLLLIILAAGVSVYAIVQLGLVKNVTRSIIMNDNYLIDLNTKLTDAFLSETRHEKKFIIMQDTALYDGFYQAKEDFDQSLIEAISLTDSAEVRDLLARVAQLNKRYKTLFDEEVGFLKEGRRYSKLSYAKEKEKIADEIIEELKKFRPLNQKNILKKIKGLSEAGTRARKVAIVITSASLLFGIVLSIVITRSITVPLSEMKKKTKDIAQGVFDADLSIPSPPEIGELAKDFNLMCSKLKEVDRMKSDFFALMSHELRTPLTSIKEGTNLLLEGLGGELTEKQTRLLTIITEESNRLIGLVNSMLDLSKMEAGMLSYNFMWADLPPLIQKVIVEVMPLAEAKHIRIDKDIEELKPIKMDTERILQVVRNLVGNALKFTPKGGTVSISVSRTDNGIKVSVTDTGPGIPKEHLSVIFDKFHQVTHEGSSKTKGTGLGLAIVRHIINSHGGNVWVESTVGRGSTFIFVLPV